MGPELFAKLDSFNAYLLRHSEDTGMDRQEIIDAIKTARQITDKSMPFEANVAQSDVTALRVAAFTAVLGKLLGNAAEYASGRDARR
jgi:hypothetical protein